MLGIMQLRQNFRGGGADLGTASAADFGMSGGREARNEGAIAERMAQTQRDAEAQKELEKINRKIISNIEIEPEITRKQRNRNRINRFLNVGLNALLPTPLKIAYSAYQSYPKIANMVNQLYGRNLPTYQPQELTSLLTPTGTIKEVDKTDRGNNSIIPFGITSQQPQMLADAPIIDAPRIDIPRKDLYPFLSAADFDIDPQYRQYGIGNLYG